MSGTVVFLVTYIGVSPSRDRGACTLQLPANKPARKSLWERGVRDPAFLLCVSAAWDDPELDEEAVAWAREAWETLRGQSATIEGFYPGFPGVVAGEERARMADGDNHDRLVAIETTYDPENRFSHNLNVEPAVD